jgi:hypothetical protein
MLKIKLLAAVALGCAGLGTGARAQETKPGDAAKAAEWTSLFDGKTLAGWKATEHPESFKVEDGLLVAGGERGHLFYVGDGAAGAAMEPLVNFEFKAEVMTTPKSNSGIHIHTQLQDAGWLKYGYECQVNNTANDPIKTGSLYSVVDVFQVATKEGEPFLPGVRVDKERVMLTVAKAPANDNEWFTYEIRVNGKRITTRVNGVTMVDYTEPDNKKAGEAFTRVLDKGTIAIQAHDPQSKVFYRNIQLKRLP